MFHLCPEEHIQVACADRLGERNFHDVPEHVEELVFHEDQEEQDAHADFDLNVQDEVTEHDMIHKMLFHEDAEYKEEAGVVFHGKGNRILLWSDEEDG